MRCSRGERYRGHLTDLDTAARPGTKTQTCHCPFKIKAKEVEGGWVIYVRKGLTGTHNHRFIKYPEGFRHAVRLTQEAKEAIRECRSWGIKPAQVMIMLKDRFPQLRLNVNQIYNYNNKLRHEEKEGRNAAQQCLELARSHGYLSWFRSDPTNGALTHCFLAHPTSIKLLRTFPYFIGMDTTYKTNHYGMPLCEIVGMTSTNLNFLIAYVILINESADSYKWVLERFQNLLGDGVQPSALVTDRELGLGKAIEQVFPGTPHLLCVWHIGNDVKKKWSDLHGKPDAMQVDAFQKFQWNPVAYAKDMESFELALAKLRSQTSVRFMKYVEDTWLVHKEKFIVAWTKRVPHFGNQATSRVESEHSSLKYYLRTSRDALDTVWRRAHAKLENQHTKIKKSFEESRSTKGRMYMFPFWQNLWYGVSHHCLKLIRHEYNLMQKWDQHVYDRCSCIVLTTHGIPCACALALIIVEGRNLNLNDVHAFWKTLEIKDGVDIPEFASQDEDDITSFRQLVERVLACDPSIIRHISQVIAEELNPDTTNLMQLDVVTSRRGRPPTSSSTRPDPSAFEYIGRGRGRRSSSSRSSSRGRSWGRSSDGGRGSSSLGLDFNINLNGTYYFIICYNMSVF